MKNLQDLEKFIKEFDFIWQDYYKLEEGVSEIEAIKNADKIINELKSFILSDRQEVLKMVLESLPKLKKLKSTEEQVEIKDWECIGYNFCLSEIKEIINNLTNKIK